MRVLVVEDETDLADAVARGLRREGSKRKRRNDTCGDQAALYHTTHREHGGLATIIRQLH